MTKKPGIVWNYYNKKIDGSQIVAFCKFCNQSYIQNATRMEKHLVRCDKCPESVKETFSKHRIDKGSIAQAVKTIAWTTPKSENNAQGDWDEAYEVETVECSEDVDMTFEVEEPARVSNNDLQTTNEEWQTVNVKNTTQSANQSSSTVTSPSERTSQRKPTLRRISQWPLLPARTTASHSPLQSKILQEQLLERRIMRRVAELELRKKNLELERLQWEYERDKAQSEMKMAHENRMMEIREEREKQLLEQEMADV